MSTVRINSYPPSARLVWEAADLPSGTHAITVTRKWDGFSAVVRHGDMLFADGGAVLDDWEIPVGTDVSYTADAYDVSGNHLGTTDALTGTVTGDKSQAWISDPVNPNAVVQVEMSGDFGETLSTSRRVQTYQVGNRVVALLGAMGKLQNINLHVQTATISDADALKSILGRTSLLIRTFPPARVPRLLYVVVPITVEAGVDVQYGGGRSDWPLTGDEVSSTTLDILVPVTTWQDYIDVFPTWQDMIDAYDTWFDAMKNPPGGA